MPKKFFDIFPPNISTNQQSDLQPIKPKFSRLKEVLISIGIFIILLGGFFYFKLPRLDLEIWPETRLLSFEEKITIDINIEKSDWSNKIIPGEILEDEKELWQEFAATGTTTEEGMAEGIIRVFNGYNPITPITLKATTRFLSDSGKNFRSPKKIYIPAAKMEKGKIIPSWTDTRVVAIESGEGYNIGPAEFSVPKLAGTSYFYTVYGESTTFMEGGFKNESKQVTEEDIQKAENSLTDKLLTDVETSLKNKVSSEFILLDNTISKEVIDAFSSVKAGAVIPQFNFQAKVEAEGLILKKSDLEGFAKEFILSEISASKTLFEDSLELNYTPESIDLQEGKIDLSLEFSAKIYSDVDKNELSALLKGKSAEQIRDIVDRILPNNVSQIKINFWPFWVKKTPKNTEKININLNLE